MSVTDLEQKILDAMQWSKGDCQFALFNDDGVWQAHLGNSFPMVRLGEVEGDFVGEGGTASEAIDRLIEILRREL